ncbi:MAG: hypothetical protein JW913_16785 [Chitinispirillaceae bacterium]|nr:hypothetical protein [Chitinispirillaceae bacterium]
MVRFSALVVVDQDGVAMVTFSFSFYDDPIWRRLSVHEKLVHRYLSDRGYSGECSVSVNRICDDLGMNRKTVISATSVLHQYGFIAKNSANRRKTVYRLVPPHGTNNSQPVPPHGTNQSVPPEGISTVSRPQSVPSEERISTAGRVTQVNISKNKENILSSEGWI